MPKASPECLFVADARFYVHQADVLINQINPISGTVYAVITAVTFCRLIVASARVTWTVQPTPLEMHVTMDTILKSGAVANPINNQWYDNWGLLSASTVTSSFHMAGWAATQFARAFLVEATELTLSVETTGGTVQNLRALVVYSRYV